MTHLIAAAGQSIPGYCTSGHGILTPAEWKTCWDIGWNQPATTAANAGYFAGRNVAPVLIGLLILLALIAVARRSSSGSPAATKN